MPLCKLIKPIKIWKEKIKIHRGTLLWKYTSKTRMKFLKKSWKKKTYLQKSDSLTGGFSMATILKSGTIPWICWNNSLPWILCQQKEKYHPRIKMTENIFKQQMCFPSAHFSKGIPKGCLLRRNGPKWKAWSIRKEQKKWLIGTYS